MTFTQKELYKPEKFMINVGLQVRLLCTPASHTYASSHSSIYHQARCVARVRRDATTAVQSADSPLSLFVSRCAARTLRRLLLPGVDAHAKAIDGTRKSRGGPSRPVCLVKLPFTVHLTRSTWAAVDAESSREGIQQGVCRIVLRQIDLPASATPNLKSAINQEHEKVLKSSLERADATPRVVAYVMYTACRGPRACSGVGSGGCREDTCITKKFA